MTCWQELGVASAEMQNGKHNTSSLTMAEHLGSCSTSEKTMFGIPFCYSAEKKNAENKNKAGWNFFYN